MTEYLHKDLHRKAVTPDAKRSAMDVNISRINDGIAATLKEAIDPGEKRPKLEDEWSDEARKKAAAAKKWNESQANKEKKTELKGELKPGERVKTGEIKNPFHGLPGVEDEWSDEARAKAAEARKKGSHPDYKALAEKVRSGEAEREQEKVEKAKADKLAAHKARVAEKKAAKKKQEEETAREAMALLAGRRK